ncbi:tRNA glutamyl-Q(34) synthetase GluQRS [Methylophilus aquaticus]|uniref:Glutamyl-Q tRNA(Asp) synthetase n=1 Tax=Methylophilus aquaticus TaxID=1971610 RepID=A0ABT9JUT5_9PROT|nr:tRNA glutamyl-Q(34) synthetase GluQRS [Methylophilus aquaticus]MDP8568309.1 tRNA glutamyl-Q(34) synthetase GluQRS [Methylophilus aquaticus]
MTTATGVVGRFAPSPTGPLHFGSLVAAVASYCDAKSRGGQWLLRIEDVDLTRRVSGASEDIISTLQTYGFQWDSEIVYQSQRDALYQQALDTLIASDSVYPCTCSRKEIADSSTLQGIEGAIYPGTCRTHAIKPNVTPAWRMKTSHVQIGFKDLIQGPVAHWMDTDIGDFVLKRADDLFSYQLAVTVDDAAQGITHVVRGADLLHSTPRQLCLQRALGFTTPLYAHIPLVTHADGQKLSKQTLAHPLPADNVIPTLLHAFQFLRRFPEPIPVFQRLPDCWDWAIRHWCPYGAA